MIKGYLTYEQLLIFANEQAFYTALFLFMVLDVLTGFLAAVGTRTVSSDISWKGMSKKVMMWGMVLSGIILGWIIDFDGVKIAGQTVTLGAAVASGFIVTEVISILENGGKLGIVPQFIKEVLPRVAANQTLVQTNVQAPAGSKIETTVEPAPDSMVGGQRRGDPQR